MALTSTNQLQWLEGRPMQLTRPGLLPRHDRPLGLGAVLPEDQLRWILCRAHSRGLALPEYDLQHVLETLVRVDLAPAPWHRVLGDRLLSAGVVLHASWQPGGGTSASVLGMNGLWTVHLDPDHPPGGPAAWGEGFLAQAYDDFLEADLPARGCGVSAVVPGHEWALRRVWPDLEQRTGQLVAFADSVPVPGVPPDMIGRFFAARLREECQRLALPQQEGVPLAECDARWTRFTNQPRVRQLLPELRGRCVPLGLTNTDMVVRRCLTRSVHDWYADEGRPDMTVEISARPAELRHQNSNPRPVRCVGGPVVCDDCRWTPECQLPALCYQEAWAVALVASMPLDQNPVLHRIPAAEAIFDELLRRVKVHDGLTDLAGLRFRHVPSRVVPAGRQEAAEAAASLGWASGASVWGPMLGDHVVMHDAFYRHGGPLSRCYTVLTTGGLVMLIVRVAHAARWAEEARQLGWDEERRRAFGLTPFAGRGGSSGDPAADTWGAANTFLPCKMYWWPPGHAVGEETLDSDPMPWKWRARRAFNLMPYRPDEPVQSSCPAALVFTWAPRPGTLQARSLAALALRQQNFLYLCARVRAEAGLCPVERADPAACFYRGCRGANPRVPAGCVPVHRRHLPGQTFSGRGSLMTLPGLVSDGARALASDPSMPKDMTRRLGVYQTAVGHAEAGRLPTVREMAAETGVRNLLFLRAVVSELGQGPPARVGELPPREPVATLEYIERPFEQYENQYAELSCGNKHMEVARLRPSRDVRCDALRQAAESAARAAAEWAAGVPTVVRPAPAVEGGVAEG